MKTYAATRGQWLLYGAAEPEALTKLGEASHCFRGARTPNSSLLPLGSRLVLGCSCSQQPTRVSPYLRAAGIQPTAPGPERVKEAPQTLTKTRLDRHACDRRGPHGQGRKAAGGWGQSETERHEGQVRDTRASQPETRGCPRPRPQRQLPWSGASTAMACATMS